MDIRGLTSFTLLDYPEHLACVVYCARCNMRCRYCQNPYLVLWPDSQPRIEEGDLLEFLDWRRGKLNGVVVSGGEPTLQPDLPIFLQGIKDRGYHVKLDTNGSNPRMLKRLIQAGLVDMLGIDYKAPVSRYSEIAARPIRGLGNRVRTSIAMGLAAGLPVDVRTTVHRDLLAVGDLQTIRQELDAIGVGTWWLQQFHPCEMIDGDLKDRPTYSDAELCEIASTLGHGTRVRGLQAS